jgi:hypothetical protein
MALLHHKECRRYNKSVSWFKLTSPLLKTPPNRRSWLIASSEARFNNRSPSIKEVIPKRALNLITPKNLNLTLHHLTAPQTINSHAHLKKPPHKKTLNLISLSYPMVEREIRLIDAKLPYRRPPMMHGFKVDALIELKKSVKRFSI